MKNSQIITDENIWKGLSLNNVYSTLLPSLSSFAFSLVLKYLKKMLFINLLRFVLSFS